MFNDISSRLASFLWRVWYPLLSDLLRNSGVVLLNYGYDDHAAPKLALEPADEPDRACIQLYHRVAGAIDVTGLAVLEVSCGHGGGASSVARYLKPASLCGVDRNPKAIRFCRRRHQVNGLTFACGDALKLDFANDTFGAVINVEASHCYPDFGRFLGEVRRVLRGGGCLLFADFREKGAACALLRDQIMESGLEIVEEQDISLGVVRGMRLNSDKYTALIHRLVPRLLWSLAGRFAGTQGSPIHRELESGDTVYFRYVLRKPFARASNPV